MKKIVLFGGDIKMSFRLKIAIRGLVNLVFWCLPWILLKKKTLDCLWKSKVPSKIFIFGRRLILNKFPTRMELTKRGIIEGPHNVVCPLCFKKKEDMEHLFCSCSFYNLSWMNFCVWIDVDAPSLGDCLLVRLQHLNSTHFFLIFWTCILLVYLTL